MLRMGYPPLKMSGDASERNDAAIAPTMASASEKMVLDVPLVTFEIIPNSIDVVGKFSPQAHPGSLCRTLLVSILLYEQPRKI